MVDDRRAELFFGPFHRIRIGTFARQEQSAEALEIVFLKFNRVGIFFTDGAKGGRCGEQSLRAVLGNHAPEGPRIGRADGLALIDNRRRPNDERRVDDVGMTDDPSNIGGGPKHIAGANAVNAFHGP
jgi:hypothetical protein